MTEETEAELLQLYKDAESAGNKQVQLETLELLNKVRSPQIRQEQQRMLPPDPVEEIVAGGMRGGLGLLDAVTYPVRAPLGVSGIKFEDLMTAPTTPEGRVAEQAVGLGGGAGIVSKLAQKAIPKIAGGFAPVRDAALAGAAGAGGQVIREQPEFPGQEAAALGTEALGPLAMVGAGRAAGKIGAAVAANPAAAKALKLAGKLPTIRAVVETKRMLTKQGQYTAAEKWFRDQVGDNLDETVRQLDNALEMYNEFPTVGAITKDRQLLGVEQAYRKSTQWLPQANRMDESRDTLNEVMIRAIEHGSMPDAMYTEAVILSRLADELPDKSLKSLRRWMKRNPHEVAAVSLDTELGRMFQAVSHKKSSVGRLDNLLTKNLELYEHAEDVLGKKVINQVSKLFSRKLRPEHIANKIMDNVHTAEDYEAVITVVAGHMASRMRAAAKGALDGVVDTRVARKILEEFARPGFTKAFNTIFRDEQARKVFQAMKEAVRGYAKAPAAEHIPDIPNKLVAIGGRVLGARIGRNVSAAGGGGSDIQTPAIFSGALGDAARSMTGHHFHDRIVTLLTDKKVAQQVLTGKVDITEFLRVGRPALSLGRFAHIPAVVSDLEEEASP